MSSIAGTGLASAIAPSFAPARYASGPPIAPESIATHGRLVSQRSEWFNVVANAIQRLTIQNGAQPSRLVEANSTKCVRTSALSTRNPIAAAPATSRSSDTSGRNARCMAVTAIANAAPADAR